MSKFKIGDVVRLVKPSHCASDPFVWISSMNKHNGAVITIKEIKNDGECEFIRAFGWRFNTKWMELVSDEKTNANPATRYPAYYKDVSSLTVIDVYAVHKLFGIDDPSGAIQHASKKLLLSGVRTGGKSKVDDVREARDTLTRWLELEADGC